MKKVFTRREFLRYGAGTAALLGVPSIRALAGEPEKQRLPSHLNFLGPDLTVLYRASWTRVVPTWSRMCRAKTFSRITVHHAGNTPNVHKDRNSIREDLDGILSAHNARNYGDIAYHLVIDYAGRVWEGRSLGYEGAHVTGENEENLGVMLLGNFDLQQPSAMQVASLGKVLAGLCRQFRVKRGAVYGHRELGASRCPGKHMYSHVSRLRFEKSLPKRGAIKRNDS